MPPSVSAGRTIDPLERSTLAGAATLVVATLIVSLWPASATATPLPQVRINPNAASRAELMLLPGVGPTLAGYIAAQRVRHPFATPADLDLVPRIGPRTIEKLTPWLSLPADPDTGRKEQQ